MAKSAERVISGTEPLANSIAAAGIPKNPKLAMAKRSHDCCLIRADSFLIENGRTARPMIRYRSAWRCSEGRVEVAKGSTIQAEEDRRHSAPNVIQTDGFMRGAFRFAIEVD
jgi:hypothetical protein